MNPTLPPEAYDQHGCVRYVIDGKLMPWAPASVRAKCENPPPDPEPPAPKQAAPRGSLRQAVERPPLRRPAPPRRQRPPVDPGPTRPRVRKYEQRIIELHGAGMRDAAIAAELGCAKSTVSNTLIGKRLRRALPPPQPKRPWSRWKREEQERAVAARIAGVSAVRIAREFGCGRHRITRMLEDAMPNNAELRAAVALQPRPRGIFVDGQRCCMRGHVLTEETAYIRRGTEMACKLCAAERSARRYERAKAVGKGNV